MKNYTVFKVMKLLSQIEEHSCICLTQPDLLLEEY